MTEEIEKYPSEIDMNGGVQIIIGRMRTNPEEFFGDSGRWNWIFKETLREVMTEVEKAALYEGLKYVRRVEITAKAAATVLKADEESEQQEMQAQLATSTGTYGQQKMVTPKGRLKDLL